MSMGVMVFFQFFFIQGSFYSYRVFQEFCFMVIDVILVSCGLKRQINNNYKLLSIICMFDV